MVKCLKSYQSKMLYFRKDGRETEEEEETNVNERPLSMCKYIIIIHVSQLSGQLLNTSQRCEVLEALYNTVKSVCIISIHIESVYKILKYSINVFLCNAVPALYILKFIVILRQMSKTRFNQSEINLCVSFLTFFFNSGFSGTGSSSYAYVNNQYQSLDGSEASSGYVAVHVKQSSVGDVNSFDNQTKNPDVTSTPFTKDTRTPFGIRKYFKRKELRTNNRKQVIIYMYT